MVAKGTQGSVGRSEPGPTLGAVGRVSTISRRAGLGAGREWSTRRKPSGAVMSQAGDIEACVAPTSHVLFGCPVRWQKDMVFITALSCSHVGSLWPRCEDVERC